ncbi:MAG: hypothetical protein ACRCY3_10990 [Sphingorhabdus sp.]
MRATLSFFRSDLFLSLAGGFALGIAAIAFIRPASAETEHGETKALIIDMPASIQDR